MSTDPFLQSPLRRALSTTWPLFTAFGVKVRVSWTIAVWPLLFLVGCLPWMGFGEALFWGAAMTIGLFASVYTHEMGHIVMAWRCGIDSSLITLRGLGGLAHLDAPAQSADDDIKIALAGPATHLLWVAVLYPAKWLLEPEGMPGTWWIMLAVFASLQISMMIFNLLPIYPMDGGRVLRGMLSKRMSPNLASLHAATVGFVGNGLLIALGLLGWTGAWDPFGYSAYGFVMVWIGIAGIQACRGLRLQARHGEIYGPQDPFAATLRASAEAMREIDAAEEKERRAREKVRTERAELQATVDRLLDRITEAGGVDKLSPRERRELERASKRLSEFD